jgi:hypothetical protein
MLQPLLGFLPLSSSVHGHCPEVLYVVKMVKIVNNFLQRNTLQKDNANPDGAGMSNRKVALCLQPVLAFLYIAQWLPWLGNLIGRRVSRLLSFRPCPFLLGGCLAGLFSY